MASRIKGITIEIDGKTTGLEKSLANVTRQSMSVTKELSDVQRLLKLNPGNTELIAQKQKLLAEQIDLTGAKLQALKAAQSDVQAQFEKGAIGEEQYRAFQREIEATEGALNGYKGQLASVSTEQDNLAQNTKRLDTLFEATGTSVEDFQDILGSKLANAIKNGTANADDLEVAINKIGRASLGQDGDIAKLKSTLDSLDDGNSIETVREEIDKLGPSAEDATSKVSKLTEIAGSQLMMDVADKAAEASEKIIEIGTSAVEAAATAKANAAQFTQVFGNMEADARKVAEGLGEELGMVPERITPGLAKMTSMFKGLGYDTKDAMDMAEKAVRSSADAAAFYDQSFEDANGSLTSFLKGNYEAGESVGVFANDTQMAAFAISKNLIPATEGAKEATEKQLIAVEKAQKAYQEAVKKYGEGSIEARDKMLAVKTAQDDITASTSEQAGKWTELDEATKQAVRLEYIQNMQNMAGSTGQASREMDGYENVMGNVNSLTETFMSAIGDEALNMFVQLAMELVPILQQIVDWVRNLNPTVKQFLTIVMAVIAIVGLVLPIVVALSAAITLAGGAAAFLTTVLLPVIAIVAAIVLAIVAAVAIFQNWGTIVDWFTEKFGFLAPLFSNFGNVLDIFNNFFVNTFNNIKMVISGFVSIVQGILDIIVGIFTLNGEKIGQGFAKVFQGLVSVAGGLLSQALNVITSTLSAIANVFGTILGTIISIVANIFAKIVDAIMHPVETAKGLLKTAIDAIKGLFNFKFSWPKIPLPHFSISGSVNPLKWLKEGVPKISVDWFAKGGILTKPTVFGQNGNSLMVGGEAGKEAVAPIDTLMGYVRQAVSEAGGGTDPELIAAILALANRPVVLSVNGKNFAEAVQEDMSTALENQKNKRAWENGFRSVKA